jgi:hypothetical protein
VSGYESSFAGGEEEVNASPEFQHDANDEAIAEGEGTEAATTVDDRNPEGEDETVGMEHIDDFRPPAARENLRLT